VTRRFFIPPGNISGSRALITGSDVDHARRVLRLKEGDSIELRDGSGRVFASKIISLKADSISCEVISSRSARSEPKTKVSLLQSIPKESKMDMIIQKCTELGVSEIIPVQSERSVVRLSEEKKKSRLARWQKIAKEAAEQSGRGIIPRINAILDFNESLKLAGNFDLSVIPWEMEEKTTLKKHLNSGVASILIAVGPEGGFSKAEVDKAVEAGFRSVSLGKRILRTETAGIAALAMINYALEM